MHRRDFLKGTLLGATGALLPGADAEAHRPRLPTRLTIYGNSLCQHPRVCWPWQMPRRRFAINAGVVASDNLAQTGPVLMIPHANWVHGHHDAEYTDAVIFHGYDLRSALAGHDPHDAADQYLQLVIMTHGSAPSMVVLSHPPRTYNSLWKRWVKIMHQCYLRFTEARIPLYLSHFDVSDGDYADELHLTYEGNSKLAAGLEPWINEHV